MSLFDWLFRRGRKIDPESLAPAPSAPTSDAPLRVAATPTSPPQAAPEANADPYAATEFLPVSRQEIIDAAKSTNLLATAFQFGRQSIIPPVSDPRTQLIDRALVTHG